MDVPKIVVDERGWLRVKLPSGEMLPETQLIINNMVTDGKHTASKKCMVTVTFEAEHTLVKETATGADQ